MSRRRFDAMQSKLTVIGVVCWLLTTSIASAQVVVRSAGGETADVLVMQELGVVVGPSEDGAEVEIQMLLPDRVRDPELEQGDLVFMIDGDRVEGLATLREVYEAKAEGETVKIGIRRGSERFLTAFDRASADESGHGTRMMVMRSDGGEMLAMHEIGAIVGVQEELVKVTVKLPIGESAVEEGDRLITINGEDAEYFEDVRYVYEGLETGAPLQLQFERDGETFSIDTHRSDPPAGMMIRRGTR